MDNCLFITKTQQYHKQGNDRKGQRKKVRPVQFIWLKGGGEKGKKITREFFGGTNLIFDCVSQSVSMSVGFWLVSGGTQFQPGGLVAIWKHKNKDWIKIEEKITSSKSIHVITD